MFNSKTYLMHLNILRIIFEIGIYKKDYAISLLVNLLRNFKNFGIISIRHL